MNDLDPSLRSSLSEVEKSDYLSSLGDENSLNINTVANAFLDHLRQTGRRGALIAVGGTVNLATRGTSRKDIDLLAVIENSHDFDDWSRQIEQVSREAGITVSQILKPIPDREYDIPNFNLHDGSVILSPNSGVPIEIVNSEVWKNVEEALERLQAKVTPFSVLSRY